MNHLWTSKELECAVQGKANKDFTITGLSINTRTLQKGDMYIALQGVSQDGHGFVQDAFERGAIAAMVSENYDIPPSLKDHAFIVVKDPFVALYDLGKAARARSKAQIVAITGSAGKTSTRQMLSLVLQNFGQTAFSPGGHNNHWGLPLSLAKLSPDDKYGVFEMGMNHAGEITPLTALARPDVAIITNVEKVHLENFSSFEGIAEAKAEIFQGVSKGGTAVLNRDNPFYDFLVKKAHKEGIKHILSFGVHKEADVHLLKLELTSEGSKLRADFLGKKIDVMLNAPGHHMALNALAVLAAVHALGLDATQAAPMLAAFKPLQGRGAQQNISFKGGQIRLIDESYNASFVAIKAALQLLAATPLEKPARRVVVLGDMLELGAESEAIHLQLKAPLIEAGCDLFFAVGPMMKKLYESLPLEKQGGFAGHVDDLISSVKDTLNPGDALLIKGSRRWKLETLVDVLTLRKAV